MITTLHLVAASGWFVAIFLGAALYGAHLANNEWRRRDQKHRDEIYALERGKLSLDLDSEALKWYRAEHTRLTEKCRAICAALRRRKDRGKVTCQMDPTHTF